MRPSASGILAFTTSGAVLVMEIIAFRLLAPYVGVTLQTTTAIISIVLAGIAGGAWLGGRVADRCDARRLLGPIIILGGGLVMASLAIVRSLGPMVGHGGAAPALTVAGLAFFAPAAVLSMVAPILVKLALSDLSSAGSHVGRISALGTAGAIVGSFLSGFLLVSTTTSTSILMGTGLFVVLLGLVVWFKLPPRDTRLFCGAFLAAWMLGLFASVENGPCDLETAYFCARSVPDPYRESGRTLYLDDKPHSYVDLQDPMYIRFPYIGALAAAADAHKPPGHPVRALHIGGGGFSLPRYLRATRPGSDNLVIERNPELVKFAQANLALRLGDGLRVLSDDARVLIRQQEPHWWDIVIGDAFGGEAVPWHIATREFTQEIADRLIPDGVYLLNVIDHPPRRFVRAQVKTVKTVFPHVVVASSQDAIDGKLRANFVVMASTRPLDLEAVRKNLATHRTNYMILEGSELDAWVGDPEVLTDDFAPVDRLLGS